MKIQPIKNNLAVSQWANPPSYQAPSPYFPPPYFSMW